MCFYLCEMVFLFQLYVVQEVQELMFKGGITAALLADSTSILNSVDSKKSEIAQFLSSLIKS